MTQPPEAILDLDRLAEIGRLLGTEAQEIIAGLAEGLRTGIERIDQALAEGNLPDTVQAAHQCRNDALMVGAGALLSALSDLEVAARSGRLADARQALPGVLHVWPMTRAELDRAAGAR
jgi:hypothetical protein